MLWRAAFSNHAKFTRYLATEHFLVFTNVMLGWLVLLIDL